MNKLKVGIFIDQSLVPTYGGSFSYFYTLVREMQDFEFHEAIEIVNILVGKSTNIPPFLTLETITVDTDLTSQNLGHIAQKIRSIYALLRKNIAIRYLAKALKSRNIIAAKSSREIIAEKLIAEGVDVLLYLTPQVYLPNYPYAVVNWDLGHKSTYAFPELTMNGSYEIRENSIKENLNRALMILCESDAGADEIRKYYNIGEHKIRVFPIFGSSALMKQTAVKNNALEKLKLKKDQFFLYPAQFWTLKNHYHLLIAFKAFQTQYPDVKLVLCGSDQGNLPYIKGVISELHLEHSVITPGFVEDEVLITFYENAIALVFPTFLGPTNMPLIEAAYLKCPVLCSDLAGHREILGDNALYFSPTNHDELTQALLTIFTDEALRNRLKDDAYQHIKNSKFNIGAALQALNLHLLELRAIRKTWGKLS
ncbi:MAG: glycosyltransferase family 1 protein [Edaphocola sp.]